ncbi:hypothetical protein EJ110_NYTH36594 [Nymphaea thermarum]|nr:hypothetical protein EJ110_NYTH36594 [Nymphaea thermarum]
MCGLGATISIAPASHRRGKSPKIPKATSTVLAIDYDGCGSVQLDPFGCGGHGQCLCLKRNEALPLLHWPFISAIRIVEAVADSSMYNNGGSDSGSNSAGPTLTTLVLSTGVKATVKGKLGGLISLVTLLPGGTIIAAVIILIICTKKKKKKKVQVQARMDFSGTQAAIYKLCGRSGRYTDLNGNSWVEDYPMFIQSGLPTWVQSRSRDAPFSFTTVRYFPDESMNCYRIPGVTRGAAIIVDAIFQYGTYDGRALPPSFWFQIDGRALPPSF